LLDAPINQSINYFNGLSTNQWFDEKKKEYLKQSVLLTGTLSNIKIGEQTLFNSFSNENLKAFNEWNMETIEERQEILRKLILDVWKLELEIYYSSAATSGLLHASKRTDRSTWCEL